MRKAKSQSTTTNEPNKCLERPEKLPVNYVSERITEAKESCDSLDQLQSRTTATGDDKVTTESSGNPNELKIPRIDDAQSYLTTVNHAGPSHRKILRSIGNVCN